MPIRKDTAHAGRQEASSAAATPREEPIVFIVDDDEALRGSLALLMEAVKLKAETFATADEFLACYEPGQLGCLVLDVRLPGMSGLQLQEELLARDIELPIIFISGYADLPMAVEAMRKGAFHFIEKPVRGQTLLDEINAAIALHKRRRRLRTTSQAVAARIETLTPRELQVLDLIKVGKTTRAIAKALSISQKTAQVHRARILAKLQVQTSEGLVALLHKHNLT